MVFPVRLDIAGSVILYIQREDFYPEKIFDKVEKSMEKKVEMLCYDSNFNIK